MRIATLLTISFILAAGAFVTTMLISPPTSEASSVASPSRTEAVTICEYLPTGDVANCTIQN